MKYIAPNGLYKESLYIRGGNSAIGRIEPPSIITDLSTIQLKGFISSIQKAANPNMVESNSESMQPRMRVRIAVGTKIGIVILAGSPIITINNGIAMMFTARNE